MPAFAWRRRPTRYFGEQWVPFAEVELRGGDDRWRQFSVAIDTGAVISLMKRSAGDLLGVDPESGQRVELFSVGGNPVLLTLHRLIVRMGPNIQIPVPIALADGDDVPNLLGRAGIMDVLQMDFDPARKETRLQRAWY